jgi:hypothetical protein
MEAPWAHTAARTAREKNLRITIDISFYPPSIPHKNKSFAKSTQLFFQKHPISVVFIKNKAFFPPEG